MNGIVDGGPSPERADDINVEKGQDQRARCSVPAFDGSD
jgi:hypothetical protein